MVDDRAQIFEVHRRMLEGLAYRMLGTLADARDVVQDTYVKWSQAERSVIPEPRAWLATVCSRLALNTLQSARARRETYVGTWLPEPLIDEKAQNPANQVEIDDAVSVALMLALEKLTPAERAAFLLHDVLATVSRRSRRFSARPVPPAGNWRRGRVGAFARQSRSLPLHRRIIDVWSALSSKLPVRVNSPSSNRCSPQRWSFIPTEVVKPKHFPRY